MDQSSHQASLHVSEIAQELLQTYDQADCQEMDKSPLGDGQADNGNERSKPKLTKSQHQIERQANKMSQSRARRKILLFGDGCSSLALILCIIISHKHTIKCQTQFRPIKPQHLYSSRGLLGPGPATTTISRLAPAFGPQKQTAQLRQLPLMSYQMQSSVMAPWVQHQGAGVVAAAPPMNGPKGRHQTFLAQRVQQQHPVSPNNVRISDRRVSSSQPATNQLITSAEINQQYLSHNQARASIEQQQVPSRSPTIATNTAPRQENPNTHQHQQHHRHHWHDHNGKLLICYYATKQTAPYWPKESREFIVPASGLDQAASEFLKVNSQLASGGDPLGTQRLSSPVGHHNQLQQQLAGPFVQNTNANSLSLGPNHEQSNQVGGQQQQQQQQRSIFAGGRRLVVVAPEFVPFNRSQALNSKSNSQPMMASQHNEIVVDRADSLAHMFFMANNRRKTIADRQDNGATITSASTPTSANQSNTKQLASAQLAEFIVSNNDQTSGATATGSIVFDQNKSKYNDLNSNNNNNNRNAGGPGANYDAGSRLMPGGEQPLASFQQMATTTPTTTTISHLPARRGNPQQNSMAPLMLSVDNERSPTSVNNNRDHPERAAKARQELLHSPSMGPAFLVGTSLAASSSAPSIVPSVHYDDKSSDQKPSNGPPGASSSSSSSLNSEHSNFYYYYNLPNGNNNNNNNQGLAQTTSSAGSVTPSTANSLPAGTSLSSSFRPTNLDQQQHHELSGTTLDGFNNNGTPQRASNGLHVNLESELLLQPVSTSSSPMASASQLPLASSSPTSYFFSSNPIQSEPPPPLERLIVSNGNPGSAPMTATTTTTTAALASTTQRQRYSSPSIVMSSPKSDYLFKISNSDDGGQQMVATKTTPVVQPSPSAGTSRPNGSSIASPSSSGASASSANSQSKADDSSSNKRNQHHHNQHGGKQTVGLGGNSLSAALVSSPLSTMFDVFGAASQYLMRFKPSSLISPSSFAAFNSIGGGDHNGLHNKLRSNSSSSSLASLVSLPFANGGNGGSGSSAGHQSHHQKHSLLSITGDQRAAAGATSGSSAHSNSSGQPHVAGGFLTRLSLQGNQRREDICGRTIQTPERRIIGGEGAKYGEFPYQVHIKIAKHQCGGALIDRQSIVTAAHCVYHFITRAPVSKLQIVIGAYDIEDEQYQELPPQYFKVNKVKLHPNFRFSASHPDRYDIAILKLDKPVKYTDNVLPVCLPGKDLKYENMVGTVTGFGKTDPSLSNRYGTRLLQKVDVPIIENGECERWHRTRGIDLKIFPEMMCAGYEDGLKDACVGDSGGPLVVKTPVGSGDAHSFRWTLAGITSAGFGCAQSRQPGIYHRVSHTVDWILENLD